MITLDRKKKTSLYEQLYEQLKADITAGRFEENVPLMSLRTLEKGLGVSRTTVDRAYQQLVAEGYVRSVQGTGYFVENAAAAHCSDNTTSLLTNWSGQSLSNEHSDAIKYNFSHQGVESILFPWNKWIRALSDTIGYDSFHTRSISEDSRGTQRLRKNLAHFLYHYRGVNCVPEQIVICSSTECALDIVLSLLDKKACTIACEDPGYYTIRSLMESWDFNTVPLPIQSDGLSIDELRQSDCNVAFVTPSYQFPTGAVTPIRNRNLLLKWATGNGACIIEYDHYSSFCDGVLSVPSLQSLDKFQNVIYVGSLSMIIPGSLCCAYVVLPFGLLNKYEHRYQHTSPFLPGYHEMALAKFYETGIIESQIRKLSVVNRKKHELLCNWIIEHPSSGIVLLDFSSATHLLVKIECNENQETVLRKLERAGVRIQGVNAHCSVHSNSWENIYILGYSLLNERELIEGCELIAAVLSEENNHS